MVTPFTSVPDELADRFRHSHPDDMAVIDTHLRCLANDFGGTYDLLRDRGEMQRVDDEGHYTIVPGRSGQKLGLLIRYVPEIDSIPEPIQIFTLDVVKADFTSASSKVVLLHHLGRDRSGWKKALDDYTATSSKQKYADGRYKWFHPFGT